jgi:hypothetical protein
VQGLFFFAWICFKNKPDQFSPEEPGIWMLLSHLHYKTFVL